MMAYTPEQRLAIAIDIRLRILEITASLYRDIVRPSADEVVSAATTFEAFALGTGGKPSKKKASVKRKAGTA